MTRYGLWRGGWAAPLASAFVLLAMCTALEAGADPFEGVLYDGPHEFNAEAQDQA